MGRADKRRKKKTHILFIVNIMAMIIVGFIVFRLATYTMNKVTEQEDNKLTLISKKSYDDNFLCLRFKSISGRKKTLYIHKAYADRIRIGAEYKVKYNSQPTSFLRPEKEIFYIKQVYR